MLWISDRTTKVGIYKSKHGQCLYIYIYILQHLLFSTLIFKASYFELNAIFCILQSWLVFGDQRAAESNC